MRLQNVCLDLGLPLPEIEDIDMLGGDIVAGQDNVPAYRIREMLIQNVL